MQTPIEFASPEDDQQQNNSPWPSPKVNPYEDLVLKPEYAIRRLRFENGPTWLRIVPAFATSRFRWWLPLQVLQFERGRFVHPRSLEAKARCAYDHAYTWARENAPAGLYSRANKEGVRLLSDPVFVFWALVEEDGKYVARLFQGSGYDGSRGGAPGLGYKIWQLTRERDETGALVAEAVGAEAGVLICVEKTQPKGSKYPSYQLKLGRQPRPMAELLEQMDPAERDVLTPLENVVRTLSEEEQWRCLAKVMAPETVELIRASLN